MAFIQPEENLYAAVRSPRFKATLTSTGVITGVLVGILFIVFVAPVMLFSIGANDSRLEILAGAALLLSVLPASLFAAYSRFWAGVWLTLVGLLFSVAAAWNGYRVMISHGLHVGWLEIVGNGFLGWVAIALGLFFWITGALGWPNLKSENNARAHNS